MSITKRLNQQLSSHFRSTVLNERDYSTSRKLFIIDGCLVNAIFILTTGAFLSGFAYYLGAGASQIAIIATLPTLLNSIQIFSCVTFENMHSKKGTIVFMSFLHRLLLAVMFFIPFITKQTNLRISLLILCYSISYFFGAFVGTGTGNWLLHLVPEKHVGRYLGIKDSLSLAALTLTSLIIGKLLDYFRVSKQEHIGFFIIGLLLLVMAVIDCVCLSLIKEPVIPAKAQKVTVQDAIVKPLKDKKFRSIIWFYIFWNIACNIAGPFFAIYMILALKLDYFYIMLVTLLASLARICTSIIWGKLADHVSWLWVIKFAIGVLALTHSLWFFMTIDNYKILMPLAQILSGIAWGGLTISIFHIQYGYAPLENRVLYVSTNTAIAGFLGFGATLLGSFLLKVMGPLHLGFIVISNIQLLFGISVLCMFGCILYLIYNPNIS